MSGAGRAAIDVEAGTAAAGLFVAPQLRRPVETESRCGWLKDRFGLSWQIIPNAHGQLMGDPDPVKAGRVRDAMLAMLKIDIAGLVHA